MDDSDNKNNKNNKPRKRITFYFDEEVEDKESNESHTIPFYM